MEIKGPSEGFAPPKRLPGAHWVCSGKVTRSANVKTAVERHHGDRFHQPATASRNQGHRDSGARITGSGFMCCAVPHAETNTVRTAPTSTCGAAPHVTVANLGWHMPNEAINSTIIGAAGAVRLASLAVLAFNPFAARAQVPPFNQAAGLIGDITFALSYCPGIEADKTKLMVALASTGASFTKDGETLLRTGGQIAKAMHGDGESDVENCAQMLEDFGPEGAHIPGLLFKK